jgi:two-component system catabolic regulation response regulator CreB
MARILLIEDEPAIADAVLYALRTEGHRAEHRTLGREGLAELRAGGYELLILDIGLPDANGFELFRELRGFSDLPVIFLTARAGEVDRVAGLEMGADDYVSKPFSPRELAARVRVVLRRAGRQAPTPESALLGVDPEQARIWYCGQALDLTRYEYLLLRTLVEHPERVSSRAELMRGVWVAPDHSLERTVDTHV